MIAAKIVRLSTVKKHDYWSNTLSGGFRKLFTDLKATKKLEEIEMRPYILVVEDDEEDFQIFMESFEALGTDYEVRWMEDGEECMSFLLKQKWNGTREDSFLPNMIFLDLNMPRKNGFEVLHEVRSSKVLCHIPIIIMSSSKAQVDVCQSYKLGVNAFIQKLPDRNQFANNLSALSKFWFETAQLPEISKEEHEKPLTLVNKT